MKASLQSHEFLIQNFDARTRLAKNFEVKSRGLDTISFAGAPAGAKRLLLIGFDPSQVYQGNPTTNPQQANPTGGAALALHGQTIMNGAAPLVFVQSVILPSRLYELSYNGGEGFVEEFFTKFIDPTAAGYTPVDMIVVAGHGREWRFDVPRFAARRRQPTADNNFIVNPDFPLIPAGNMFYRSNLPFSKIVPNVNAGTTHSIFFNQTYAYTDNTGTVRNYTNMAVQGSAAINDNPNGGQPLNLLPINANQNTVRNVSGGSLLSIDGEVFYRLCLLREKKNGALVTGMIAMPRIQGTAAHIAANANVTSAFDAAKTKVAIDEFREILKKAFL
jgi:pyrrolidone-carboxylate peptidase